MGHANTNNVDWGELFVLEAILINVNVNEMDEVGQILPRAPFYLNPSLHDRNFCWVLLYTADVSWFGQPVPLHMAHQLYKIMANDPFSLGVLILRAKSSSRSSLFL